MVLAAAAFALTFFLVGVDVGRRYGGDMQPMALVAEAVAYCWRAVCNAIVMVYYRMPLFIAHSLLIAAVGAMTRVVAALYLDAISLEPSYNASVPLVAAVRAMVRKQQ